MPPSGGTAAAVAARWWQQGVGDHRVHRTWLGSGCPTGPRFFFNFSKLLFCFCPIPGCVRRRSQATRCSRVVCSGKKWQPAGCAVDDNPLAIVTQLKQVRHARARQSGLFRLGGGRQARDTRCAVTCYCVKYVKKSIYLCAKSKRLKCLWWIANFRIFTLIRGLREAMSRRCCRCGDFALEQF